ncbi:NUDIX domain protein [Mycobacteroides abscessus subsp. bolletii 1513]|uniref:NUDIX domain protein n=1 Tax=Mycobacteroides abscessus subsp. bolletii 1513 TaxID=1299321 RepID=X8DDZ3_9MYCO|nr:NUDIX domain protein [Mycobacteroides abscessus subsp. bolletii 1513]
MLPGGKPDRGENAAQTAVREVREELSVHLEPSALRPLGVFRPRRQTNPDSTSSQRSSSIRRYRSANRPPRSKNSAGSRSTSPIPQIWRRCSPNTCFPSCPETGHGHSRTGFG